MQSRNKREGTYAGFAGKKHYRGYSKGFQRPSGALARDIAFRRMRRMFAALGLPRRPELAKPMNLESWNVREAVKRVMATHGDVIKALGDR